MHTDSAPFYQKVSATLLKSPRVRFVAASRDTPEVTARYLKDHGVRVDAIATVPNAFPVYGTPTLILLDAQGKVLNSWVGMLPKEGESIALEAISRLM